ncbi:MAG: adenylate/guanylate cyclase domain-containing protein [Dehalococcoidia bacterium]
MDAPRIQYARTSDGVSIAYWTLGEGPALLLFAPAPVGHIAGELALPELRAFYERLARTHTVIRYDPRGCGASDREGFVETRDKLMLDVEAVLDSLESGPVAIVAGMVWVPVGLACAASRPDQVSHLMLWDGFARPADYQPTGRLVATRALIERDWRAYTDAWAHTTFGWSRAESARLWSRWFRDATTPERTLARLEGISTYDVSGLLPDITTPALIIDHRDHEHVARSGPQFLAARLPNARLVVLDGPQLPPFWEPERSARLIDEFTGVAAPADADLPPSASERPADTAVILFVDIADSTALTERMGDAAFRAKARELDEALRRAIATNGGNAIEGKLLGDGVLAIFTSAREAIECAQACRGAGEGVGLTLHLGLHAGDVLREEGNVYGGAVNIAARIADASAPGQVLVSDVVRTLARTSAGVAFEDRGEHALKGIAEPQRLWAVREGEA